jgi:hypothetical protein
MTTHLDDTQGLDSILARNLALIVGTYKGEPILTPQATELKQAILHWVATEVIGDGNKDSVHNYDAHLAKETLRMQQRSTLIHHGYKQNTKETGR